jgi:hypothetical protein
VAGRHERLGLGYLSHDEGHPAGCYALAPLVLASPGHLHLLTAWLLETDRDETVQSNLLRLALSAHGWREETLRLMATRLAASHGQWSQDDLAFAVERQHLLDHLAIQETRDHFLDLVVKASRRAGAGPSLSLGTLAFVFGRGEADAWRRWAELARDAHLRELVLVEPGSRYGELYAASSPDEPPDPAGWDRAG